MVATYAWGLGKASNNQVDTYALLCGILLAKEAKVKALIVIGDSMVVIKSMLGKTSSLDSKLAVTISQIKRRQAPSPNIHIIM
jgi:ribonuclease HI